MTGKRKRRLKSRRGIRKAKKHTPPQRMEDKDIVKDELHQMKLVYSSEGITPGQDIGPDCCPACGGLVTQHGECWFCSRGWAGLRATSSLAILRLPPLRENHPYIWGRPGYVASWNERQPQKPETRRDKTKPPVLRQTMQDKLKLTLNIISESQKLTGAAKDEKVFDALKGDHQIGRVEAVLLISTLMRDGLIYSPRPGYYKTP